MRKGLILTILAFLVVVTIASAAIVNDIELFGPNSGTIYRENVTFSFRTHNFTHDKCAVLTNSTGVMTELAANTSLNPVGTQAKDGTITSTFSHGDYLKWNVACSNETAPAYPTLLSSENRTLTIYINQPPVFAQTWINAIQPPAIQLDEDNGTITFGTNVSAADANNDKIKYSIISENASKVDCAVNADTGIFTYTPKPNFYGAAQCIVQADDSGNFTPQLGADGYTPPQGMVNSTVNFTVNPVNDPAVVNFPNPVTLAQESSGTLNLSQYVTDTVDNSNTNDFIYAVSSENTAQVDCNVYGSHMLNLTGASGFSGTAKCEIEITDAWAPPLLTAKYNLTIDVQAASKGFTVSTGYAKLVRNTTLSANVQMNVQNTGNIKLDNLAVAVQGLTNGMITTANGNLTVDTQNVRISPASIGVGENATITIPVSMSAQEAAKSTGTLTFSGTVNVSNPDLSKIQSFSVNLKDLTKELSMNPSEIDFGAVSRNSTTSAKSFVISNSGDVDFTNVKIDYNGSKGLVFSKQENGTYSNSIILASNLNDGQAAGTIYVKANVPESQASGTHTLDSFTITTQEGYSKSFNTKVTVTGLLLIDEIKAKVKNIGESTKSDSSVSDGDEISEKAKPGATVTISVKLKNNYDTNVGNDISEMENFRIQLEGFDYSDDDVEVESSSPRKAGKITSALDLEFKVPLDAAEDTHSLELIATADDAEGNEHEVRATVKLKVERDKHQVLIEDGSFSNSEVDSCLQPVTDLVIKVLNIGEGEEDLVLKIKNSDLGVDTQQSFTLDSTDNGEDDGKKTIRKSIRVDDNTPTGTHQFEVELFRDGRSSASSSKNVDLSVVDCKDTGESTGNAGSTVKVLGGSGQGSVESGTAAAPVTFDTSKVKFTESPAFIALLVLGNIILLGGIAWIAVKLLL